MANLPNDSGQARPYITHPCLLGRSPYCGGVGTWEGDCRRSEHGEAEITSDKASQSYPLTFPYEQRYGKCFSELTDPGPSDSNRSGVTARLSAPSARQGAGLFTPDVLDECPLFYSSFAVLARRAKLLEASTAGCCMSNTPCPSLLVGRHADGSGPT